MATDAITGFSLEVSRHLTRTGIDHADRDPFPCFPYRQPEVAVIGYDHSGVHITLENVQH